MATETKPVWQTYDQWLRRPDVDAVAAMCRFFTMDDPVHRTLRKISAKLDELGIAYAVAGGMALGAHRYIRATVDVDIVVSPEGLQAVHEKLEGLGYVRPFKNSRNLSDVETGVRIEFLIQGQYPGDGKPKPVSFPDPASAAIAIDGVRYLPLPVLIELKLASGMTNPARLRDLADVQELIRHLKLPAEMAERLNPYVRARYLELWDAIRQDAAQRLGQE
jgi:hypothetical protein